MAMAAFTEFAVACQESVMGRGGLDGPGAIEQTALNHGRMAR